MKKLMSVSLMISSCASFAKDLPAIQLFFPNPPATTVFYGETLRIPIQMNFWHLRQNKVWYWSPGMVLENVSGNCPSMPSDGNNQGEGTCFMNIVVPGHVLGQVIPIALSYHLWGKEGHWYDKLEWDGYVPFNPLLSVTVVPHGLSMTPIPTQQATANQDFVYDFRPAVRYYQENQQAGKPAQGVVSPLVQDGLRFDQAQFSIVGRPTRIGVYSFQVSAQNANGAAVPTELKVQVHGNPHDKPVFKKRQAIASAVSSKPYQLNLVDLIEPQAEFMVSNQLTFRVDTNQKHPEWLRVANDDRTLIEGMVPANLEGQEIELTLIAASNTGGDSDPFTLIIPIAHDPAKKPVIEPFRLEQQVGTDFHIDLSQHIRGQSLDESLKVIIDKVEPSAQWLHVSSLEPTFLEGNVPNDATGQTYQITLRANTLTGGSSDSVSIPLQISIDKARTPRFSAANPVLPIVYPNQPYEYDFVANNDVFPGYDDASFEIEFAKDYAHPNWLRIEHNKLISDQVPEDSESEVEIDLVIKNTPGGQSEVLPLVLTIMN